MKSLQLKSMHEVLHVAHDVLLDIFGVLKENLLALIMFLSTLFAPVIPFVISSILFILLDTGMGYWKATHLPEPEARNSNRFKRGLFPKLGIYTAIIIIFYFADTYVFNQFVLKYTSFDHVITKAVTAILIFVEFWSINENFKTIFGIGLIQAFQKVLNIIKNPFKKLLDNESK